MILRLRHGRSDLQVFVKFPATFFHNSFVLELHIFEGYRTIFRIVFSSGVQLVWSSVLGEYMHIVLRKFRKKISMIVACFYSNSCVDFHNSHETYELSWGKQTYIFTLLFTERERNIYEWSRTENAENICSFSQYDQHFSPIRVQRPEFNPRSCRFDISIISCCNWRNRLQQFHVFFRNFY